MGSPEGASSCLPLLRNGPTGEVCLTSAPMVGCGRMWFVVVECFAHQGSPVSPLSRALAMRASIASWRSSSEALGGSMAGSPGER